MSAERGSGTDMHDFHCNACGKTVQRASDKRWIKSYCDTAGRTSRLWRRTPTSNGSIR